MKVISFIANLLIIASLTIFIVTYFVRNGKSTIESKLKLLVRIAFILLIIGVIASIPEMKRGYIDGWNTASHQSNK